MDTSTQRKESPEPPLSLRGVVSPLNRERSGLMAARVLELQATVLSHETFDAAAAAFAGEVAALLKFDRAAIGFISGTHVRVLAMSNTAEPATAQELTDAFSAAMEEAIDQSSTIVLPVEP